MSRCILNLVDGDGRAVYTVARYNQRVISSCDQILQYGLIEFFSPRDARRIANSTRFSGLPVVNINGQSMWVPVSRLKYLPFFALALAAFLAFSAPMYSKSVSVFGFEITAGQVIFPLLFIFTDLINELFGYQITKRCIRYLAFILIIVAILIQISLSLPSGQIESAAVFSDASSDDITRSFDAIYTGLPQKLFISAGCLLVADNLNAYLFVRLKEFMYGKKLWLRSLCSSCFASITYTLVFETFFCLSRWQWPQILVPCLMVFKLPYFIAALPLLYGIRNYIYKQEKKMLANMGNAELLEDKEIRDAERQEYWN